MIRVGKEVYDKINSLGEGSFKCGWWGGWIHINWEEDLYDIRWTPGELGPSSFSDRVYSVDMIGEYFSNFYERNKINWPVEDPVKQEEIARFLSRKIMKARKRG